MSINITTDWRSIQERHIDPFSPIDSDNHNKLLKILGNHKAYIKGFNILEFPRHSGSNTMYIKLSPGICVMSHVVIDIYEESIIELFQCPITSRIIYVVIEYIYDKIIPANMAVIKTIRMEAYNPKIHLKLYSFELEDWASLPSELYWNNLYNSNKFQDNRTDEDTIPEWAIKAFVRKRGDIMTGFLTLNAPPVEELHAANKKFVEDSLLTIKTLNITAGNGLTGGGKLINDVVIHMGLPSTLSANSTNTTTADSHTHQINDTIARSDIIIQSGPGLIGGGDLKANLILSLGTPSDITGTSINSVSGTTHTHKFNPSVLATYTVLATSTETSALRYTGHTKTPAALYGGTTDPSATTRLNYDGYLYATRIYNSVYNDYAECFETLGNIIPYNRIVQLANKGNIELAQYKNHKIIGVVSNTYGFVLHGNEEEIQNNIKLPIAMAGTVFVDADEEFLYLAEVCDFIICSKNGFAKPIKINEIKDYAGYIVGKIINIDYQKKQYKILVFLC